MDRVVFRFLMCAGLSTALVAFLPTSAQAARTVSLQSLSVVPQVEGELTMVVTVAEEDPGAAITIERYAAGRWSGIAEITTDDDGQAILTRTADQVGSNYFRAKLAADGSDPEVTSANLRVYVRGEPPNRFESTSIPTASGDQTVGTTLVANPGAWSPKADAFTYRWNRDGVSTGKTGSRYVLSGADVGAYVTVSVAGWRGSSMTVRESRPTTRVVAGRFKTTPPEIVGRALVGESLQAQVNDWTPTPEALDYQWMRNDDPIASATSDRYTLTSDDVGTALRVTVRASAAGVEPVDVTSAEFAVPNTATRSQRTFDDVIEPLSNQAWTAEDLTYSASTTAPPWGTLARTRWDTSGAFTHAQTPQPSGTLYSAMFSKPYARPQYGAEYPGTDPSLKRADVTFTITARRFAIAYRGNSTTDAMVWVDSRPIASNPILGAGSTASTTNHWIAVSLPERRTVSVRFAGPTTFTGVDVPAGDQATITATKPRFTLGVLSDSYYEVCSDDAPCASRSAAPLLGTLTGFRVWNMSESASGYVMSGQYGFEGYQPSPFGSAKRLEQVLNAPIDALLIAGSMNDGFKPHEDHRPAVEKLLSELRSADPGLPVVLLGIEPLKGGYLAPYWRNRAATMTSTLKAMVGRHQNVVGFIDPYTDPWFTGTGSTAKPTGDGNSDQYIGRDRLHPSVAGTAHYQQRLVEELRDLPLPVDD